MRLQIFLLGALLSQFFLVSCRGERTIYILDITSECVYKNDSLSVMSVIDRNLKQTVEVTSEGLIIKREADKINNIPWSFVDTLAVEAKRSDGTILTSIRTGREDWIIGALDEDCFEKTTNITPRSIGIITTVTVTHK